MSALKKNLQKAKRRALRVRERIKQTGHPRVSVFKSLKQIYGQIIIDSLHKTVVSCSSLELKNLKGDKTAVARAVGLELAKRAKNAGIEKAVFDRGSFLYHGRIKAMADGLREGGLTI